MAALLQQSDVEELSTSSL